MNAGASCRKKICMQEVCSAADMWKNTKWGFYQLLPLLLRPAASLFEALHQNDWKPAGLLPPMQCTATPIQYTATPMQCTAIWAKVCLCQSLEHLRLVSRQMPNQCHYRAVCNILPRAIMQKALLRLTIIEHIARVVQMYMPYTIWQGEHWVADRNLISHLPAQIYNVSVILWHPSKISSAGSSFWLQQQKAQTWWI